MEIINNVRIFFKKVVWEPSVVLYSNVNSHKQTFALVLCFMCWFCVHCSFVKLSRFCYNFVILNIQSTCSKLLFSRYYGCLLGLSKALLKVYTFKVLCLFVRVVERFIKNFCFWGFLFVCWGCQKFCFQGVVLCLFRLSKVSLKASTFNYFMCVCFMCQTHTINFVMWKTLFFLLPSFQGH